MCFIASEEPKMKHPYDLCDAVEKLPASEQQTIVSLMAYKVVKSLLACEQEIARLKINFEEVETAWLLARKDLSARETLCCEEGFESWWEKNWSDDHDDEMTQKDYALAGWNAAASNAWRTTAKEALADAEKKHDGCVLAPCPLCGARADFVEDTDFQCHYIGCSNSKCGITLFATKHKTIKEQVDAWNLHDFTKAHRLQKTPVVRALRDKLARYEEALQKINDGDIDPIKTAFDALMSLPTCRRVEDDPDDGYFEPPDGSHGMQGVPGR